MFYVCRNSGIEITDETANKVKALQPEAISGCPVINGLIFITPSPTYRNISWLPALSRHEHMTSCYESFKDWIVYTFDGGNLSSVAR